MTCRAGYDPQKDRFYIAGPETGAELADLVQKVEAIIEQSALDVDAIDVRSFLCKHFRAMTKIEQDLRRAALSERRFEFTDPKPIDMQQMSLEHQCLLEVLQEQSRRPMRKRPHQRHAARRVLHSHHWDGGVQDEGKAGTVQVILRAEVLLEPANFRNHATRRLIPAGVCAEQRRQIKWTKDLRRLGVDELRAALADKCTRP